MPKRKKKLTYLGIDPGWSGGITAISSNGEVSLTSMPPTETDIYNWVRNSYNPEGTVAVIEKVWGQKGNHPNSAFKFGWSYGFLRACLLSLSIPFEEVAAMTWQRKLGIKKKEKNETATKWKERLRGISQQKYPGIVIPRDAADSVLIADFCKRKETGTL